MTRPYPRLNTVGIALGCALVVTGFMAYVRWGTSTTAQVQNTTSLSANVPLESNTQHLVLDDSVDWKKGILAVASSSHATITSPSQPLTLTDALGRDFFGKYLQLRQQNLSGNSSAVGDSVDSTIEDVVRQASVPTTYSGKDIIVTTTDTTSSVHTYGNTVALAFMNFAPRANPLEIVTDALEHEDMDSLVAIDPIITSYKKLIQALVATPVPATLASTHLDLINAVSSLNFITQQLRNVSVDPMQSMIALGTYADAEKSLRSSLLDIKSYFETHNVAFGTTEPGITFATITQNP